MSNIKKIVLTGGGSAGHCVPHLALLDDLKKYFEVYYIGSNGIEKSIIPGDVPFYDIEVVKLDRTKKLKNLLIPIKLKKSIKQAKTYLQKIQPNVIFSKGGYVSLPVVLASKSLKIPVITHESDLSMGLANKIISKYSKSVLTSFDLTATKIRNGKYSGSPIRKDLFYSDKAYALKRYNLPTRTTILVFGGGSGSRAINNIIRECLPTLVDKYNVVHICGKGNKIESNFKNYCQIEYEKEMKYAYACADLVISRSGSNAVFEILSLKKPCIFIPLENRASRGDQIQNAEYFKNQKLCEIIREGKLTKGVLINQIESTLSNSTLRKNLAKSSINSGNKKIINEILSILQKEY